MYELNHETRNIYSILFPFEAGDKDLLLIRLDWNSLCNFPAGLELLVAQASCKSDHPP